MIFTLVLAWGGAELRIGVTTSVSLVHSSALSSVAERTVTKALPPSTFMQATGSCRTLRWRLGTLISARLPCVLEQRLPKFEAGEFQCTSSASFRLRTIICG